MGEVTPTPTLPLSGGGQGGGSLIVLGLPRPHWPAAPAFLCDDFEHTWQAAQNLGVSEADDAIAVFFQAGSALSIVRSLGRLRVTVSIDLDAQAGVSAAEVGNEAAQEDVLAPDMHAELMAAEVPPKSCLCRGERMSQVS